ncbi:MAG: hypothetical protein DWQ01_10230 [Planctomycetota bacterium]|nr:MAG: hypothetical protein DWQ01_10230 [Planctomycetota bacterium]
MARPKNDMANAYDLAPPSDSRGGGGNAEEIDSPSVSAASGELTWVETDLALAGNGINFYLNRIYRSTYSFFHGKYGAGWDMSIQKMIKVKSWQGNGNPDGFMLSTGAAATVDGWYAANGNWYYHAQERSKFYYENGGAQEQLILYMPYGFHETYTRLDSGSNYFYLTGLSDLSGNEITYSWDLTAIPVITQVVDTIGRTIDLVYTVDGLLDYVTVKDSDGIEVGRLDYEYEPLDAGNPQLDEIAVLKSVEGLELATEDPVTGDVSMLRPKTEYAYYPGTVQGLDAALLHKMEFPRFGGHRV